MGGFFFLHPETETARLAINRSMKIYCAFFKLSLLMLLKIPLPILIIRSVHSPVAQEGLMLLPSLVSCRSFEPSYNIDQI